MRVSATGVKKLVILGDRREVAGMSGWPFKRRLRVLDFEKGPAREEERR